jgi:RHH-type transcriptional regulator, rel operon repressor / antitoxin RelB
MIELKLNLPKGLEKCLDYLETASKKSKEFIIKEALIQYVEDMEDIQEISVLEAIEGKNKQKTYTTEELTKILGL